MDFKQFEYVLTISEEKSFSKAAKRLFISQPSLSQYINRIEKQLGINIFDRTTTPLTLTPEGELYIETALNIKSLIEQMHKKFDDITELKKGKLNIGLTPSKANNPLPAILPIFKKKYPNIELIITEAASSELEDLLSRGLVDICIMNLPIKNKKIEYEPIFTERILLAAPPDFYFEQNKNNEQFPKIDLKLIENEQFILLRPDQRLRQISNNIFNKYNIKPKILLETRSIETSLRLSASGMGFSFIPESSVIFSCLLNPPKYYTIDEPPLTWTLVIAYKTNSYHTKAATAFAKITKEVVCSTKK